MLVGPSASHAANTPQVTCNSSWLFLIPCGVLSPSQTEYLTAIPRPPSGQRSSLLSCLLASVEGSSWCLSPLVTETVLSPSLRCRSHPYSVSHLHGPAFLPHCCFLPFVSPATSSTLCLLQILHHLQTSFHPSGVRPGMGCFPAATESRQGTDNRHHIK